MSNNKEKHFLKAEYDRLREELKAQMQVEMESHIENAYRKTLTLTQKRRNALLIRTGKQPESGI